MRNFHLIHAIKHGGGFFKKVGLGIIHKHGRGLHHVMKHLKLGSGTVRINDAQQYDRERGRGVVKSIKKIKPLKFNF